MLIALYYLVVNVVLPQIASYAFALFECVIVITITLIGIVILLKPLGLKVPNTIGSTIVGGISKVVGYLCRSLFKAIGWIIRKTLRIIPRIFNGSKLKLRQLGINALGSNVLAALVVIIVLIIII